MQNESERSRINKCFECGSRIHMTTFCDAYLTVAPPPIPKKEIVPTPSLKKLQKLLDKILKASRARNNKDGNMQPSDEELQMRSLYRKLIQSYKDADPTNSEPDMSKIWKTHRKSE